MELLFIIRAEGVPRGMQILLFESYRLRDGWANLGETFRDC